MGAYLLVAAIACAELAILATAVRPDVHPDYRAFYIDQTTTCLNRTVPGTYRLGDTISFLPDGGSQLVKVRVCGFSWPAGDGTHSLGHSSRLRFALGSVKGDLTAAVQLRSAMKPPNSRQRVLVFANDEQVADLDLTDQAVRDFTFEIPQAVLARQPDMLDVRFDYPDAAPARRQLSETFDRAIKLLSFRLAPHTVPADLLMD